MSDVSTTAALAEAATLLSDQLQVHIRRFSRWLSPAASHIEKEFVRRLATAGYSPAQRTALVSLTSGAAASRIAHGATTVEFFEQVDYSGRRLAKLNVPPRAILAALSEWERLLDPPRKRLPAAEARNYDWVQRQLQFCVTLALNRAYYQVREEESRTFFEMFRVEVEEHDLGRLLDGMLDVLSRFCRADEARLVLWEDGSWRLVARSGAAASPSPAVRPLGRARLARPVCAAISPDRPGSALDAVWPHRFRTVWSVPLADEGKVMGVMQFGFARRYSWLPRERELLLAAAERCLKAAEKARLVRDLEDRQRQLRQMAEGMVDVEEAERKRISQELHDQTGQDLLWIRLQLETIEKEVGALSCDGAAAVHEKLTGVRDLTEKTIVEIRRLIAALAPAVLDRLGLAAALRQEANRFRQFHGTPVHFRVGRLERLPVKYEVTLYRIVQECLNNIARHSSCSAINISLSSADGRIRLTVEDDGVGFDMQTAAAKRGSFGLAGIRERVRLLGGQCNIESWPGAATRGRQGTRVSVNLELPRHHAALPEGRAGRPRLNGQLRGKKHGKNTHPVGR